MSFSKAKIQRFNERGSEAPPPGSYDPKFDVKVKGFTIEKKERFQDNRSVASSGGDYCSKSVSSRDVALIPSPKFRTPQLPKKRITKPTSAGCPLTKTRIYVKQLKYDTNDELADLKVECANKDITIREHVKYIDEMKIEIKDLEKKLLNLNEKQVNIEEQHKNDIESMVTLQQGILNNREQKYSEKINSLQNELIKLKNEKDEEISKLLINENEHKSFIYELMENNKILENNLSDKNEELDKNNTVIEELKKKLEAQLEEIQRIEKKNTIAKKDNQLLDAYTEISQLKNIQEDMQIKLTNIEESRNFIQSEYNCLQKKVETLEEIQIDLENTLESRQHVIDNLQHQLLSVKTEMDKLRVDHERLIDDYEKQIADLIDEHTMETSNVLLENIENNDGEKSEYQYMNNVLSRELHDFQMIYEDVKMGLQEAQVDSGNNTGEIENQSDDDSTKLNEIDEICQEDCDLSKIFAEKIELNKKLVEREAEIARLTTALNDLTCSTATQESFCQSLQEELDNAEVELSEKKKELKDMKQEMREEAAKMVSRRRRLEVIMEENQATVAALSKRLADSNVEIEKLQKELKLNKDLVQEYRDSLEALQKSSKNVNEKVQSLMTQIEEKKNMVEELEINSIADIESLKIIFEEKIDKLKEISEANISKIENTCIQKEEINEKLRKQLAEMADKLRSAQNMLLILEEQSDAQCIKISQLQLAKQKLNHSMKGHATEISVTKNHLNNELEKHKISTKEGEDRINHLTRKIESMKKDLSSYENTKLCMEEQIRTLENEKSLRKFAEEKINKLTESNQRLHKNYQEMTNKYTDIISKQNEKSTTKCYEQLQEKLKILEKNLDEKSHLVEQQSKTIEKLQADEKRRLTHLKGKENLSKSQISKSPFGTPVSSPHKPLTPLRDRND